MYYWANAYDKTQTKDYAWFYYNAYGSGWTTPHAEKGGTQPIGTKLPNAFGLYDMSGNVWEWCWDWYGTYDTAAQSDPRSAEAGSFRVDRGGDWGDGNIDSDLRSANRFRVPPSDRGRNLGLRLARTK